MKLNEIQELIKFVARSGVNEVEIQQKDFKIVIKSEFLAKKKTNFHTETQLVQQTIPVGSIAQPIVQTTVPNPNSGIIEKNQAETTEPPSEKETNYITIKAQMIGTFYRSSSPDKPPFIEVGDTIKTGETICIIEAMKLFNEIESEVTGKIVKVLVDDASPVEFDQPLFLIEPI